MSNSLENSPADVVRWLLIQLGLGTNPEDEKNWPVEVSNEPDKPDNLITVYDTAGITDGRVQRTGETAEHRGVMFQIRGTSQPVAWGKAEEIKTVIDESVVNSTVIIGAGTAGKEYVVFSITRHSGPVSLGREPGTNRFLFTINAVVALRQVT